MNTTHDSGPGPRRLVELDQAECWELLQRRPVGHLVWQRADGPFAVPVNFVVEGEEIVLHTTAYSSIARECDDATVAFAVDDLAVDNRSGWNVLVRGRAHIDWKGTGGADAVDPWPDGARPLRLRVTATSLSGRRLTGP